MVICEPLTVICKVVSFDCFTCLTNSISVSEPHQKLQKMGILSSVKTPVIVREALSEFISTFILMSFGIGSVAQYVLSRSQFGTFFSVNLGWGMGVTFGCYWGLGISGAHMNPAVTLAFAVIRRLQWKKVPTYWLSQLLGSIIASGCCYGVYYDALNNFDGGTRQILGANGTAGIWATYPRAFLTTQNGFADQLFGTMLLVGGICAVTDKRNTSPPKGVIPIVIGLLVFAIGATFGFNSGYAVNPARDLGPRIFTAMAGWGINVFTVRNNWSWVPVVACFVGGVLGALLYIVFIEMHHQHSSAYSQTRKSSDYFLSVDDKESSVPPDSIPDF